MSEPFPSEPEPTPIRPVRRGRRALRWLLILAGIGLFAWFGRPWMAKFAIHRGTQALEARQLDNAAVWFRRAESFDALKGEPEFRLARVERMRGRLDRMNVHLKNAAKAGFAPLRLHREQVLAYAQSGRMRQIESEIPDMMMDPGEDSAAICEAVVSGYMQSFQLKEAMGLLDAWRRDHPQDPQPLAIRGMYFAQRQSWSKAAEEFERALEIGPRRDDIRMQWADALLNVHNLGKARAQFELVLKTSPQDTAALVGLGRCLLELGELKLAEQRFRQGLQTDPQSWDARFWLGKLLSSDGKVDEALPLLETVCQEKPYEPDVRYTLARTLQAAGRGEEAQEHFRYVTAQQKAQSELRNLLETLERSPARADLRLQIGKTLLEYGNPTEGIGWLQSVLELVPNHPEAQAAILAYQQGREKPRKP